MNTERVLIIPDEVVHDVKNQATKVWRDHSFRWIQPRCCSMTMTHASDRTATQRRRWCSHPPVLSLRCHAAAACMLVSQNSRVISGWFSTKLKNVSCEYDRLNGWNSTLQAAWFYKKFIEYARTIFCVQLSINNIVGLVHKNHIMRTRLMYHAACKVES